MAFGDWIRIRDLTVDCVVGVYPHERNTPQPLVVEVAMCLDTERAAVRERLRYSVDYASVCAQLSFLLTSCRFRLLETAAHALCRYLLAPPTAGEQRPAISRVELTLTKPGALGGRAVPSLKVERGAQWATIEQEHKPFGVVDVIHETRDAGIYRLNVAAGGVIPLHVHRVMSESEMVLTGGLLCQGKPVATGTIHRWPKGAAHCYENPTGLVQSILCVDCPAFIEQDEILVQGPPAEVQPEA